MNYTQWVEYIAKGKNKMDRPIGNSQTKRAYHSPDDTIRLRLHYTDVVTLYSDGTEVINTGGWNTVTTKAFIREHSNARVWSEKGQLFVRTDKPEITPSRVQKCRTCKGTGEVTYSCSGPGWCYPYYFAGVNREPECEHGQTNSHRKEACRHGQPEGHALSPEQCSDCNGEGRRDYGSKPVHYKWDGGPLRIDQYGYPIGPVETASTLPKPWNTPTGLWQQGYGTIPVPPEAPAGYSDSGALLSATLPALSTRLTCPHCDSAYMATLEQLIIHLNDDAKWTREQVADWLDTLDVDLSFPVPDTIPAHIH